MLFKKVFAFFLVGILAFGSALVLTYGAISKHYDGTDNDANLITVPAILVFFGGIFVIGYAIWGTWCLLEENSPYRTKKKGGDDE